MAGNCIGYERNVLTLKKRQNESHHWHHSLTGSLKAKPSFLHLYQQQIHKSLPQDKTVNLQGCTKNQNKDLGVCSTNKNSLFTVFPGSMQYLLIPIYRDEVAHQAKCSLRPTELRLHCWDLLTAPVDRSFHINKIKQINKNEHKVLTCTLFFFSV